MSVGSGSTNARTERPLRAVVVALTSAMIASACSGSTLPHSVSSGSAVIYGRVTNNAGAPVVGAVLQASAYEASCAAPGNVVVGSGVDMVGTDASGAYRQRVVAIHSVSMCVVITVTPPPQSMLGAATASTAVVFKPSATPPYDSARFDIVLH